MTNLTKKERMILEILWNSSKPLLLSDILQETRKKQIADNSVSTMIRSLINKGYVKVLGSVVVGKSISRFYAPSVTIDEYAAMQLQNIYKTSNKKPDIVKLLNYLSRKNRNNMDGLISGLEEFIDKYKNNKKNTE